jgi:thioester reductase-like protein
MAREDVRVIYCFVRAKNKTAAEDRVNESLQKRQLYATISPMELKKLHCLPVALTEENFGLSSEDYTRVQRTTAVIHAAWPVNFKIGLKSFESQIKGTSVLRDQVWAILCWLAGRSDSQLSHL